MEFHSSGMAILDWQSTYNLNITITHVDCVVPSPEIRMMIFTLLQVRLGLMVLVEKGLGVVGMTLQNFCK